MGAAAGPAKAVALQGDSRLSPARENREGKVLGKQTKPCKVPVGFPRLGALNKKNGERGKQLPPRRIGTVSLKSSSRVTAPVPEALDSG